MVRSTTVAWWARSCAFAGDADDAVGTECLDGLLQGVLVAARDAHAVTARDEGLRDAVADAAARARDERDLAGEFGECGHVVPSGIS